MSSSAATPDRDGAKAPPARIDQAPWSLERVRRRFHALEAELALLPRTVAGCRYWEFARVDVFSSLCRQLGLLDEAHSPVDRSVSARLRMLPGVARSGLFGSPYLERPVDVLVFGHPRRKREADGTWWDVYCDPWLETLRASSLLLERPHRGRHFLPARTRRIAHLDLPMLISSAARLTQRLQLAPAERRELEELEGSLSDGFGVAVPLLDPVTVLAARRRSELGVLRTLLRRLRPRLVVLVVSYGQEVLLEACQDLGIPTVELQHGVISPYHLGYAVPPELGRKRFFPDWFLSFGRFWARDASFPLPEERVVPVGYPYFEHKREEHALRPRRDRVLFISQRSVGRQLSRMAARLAQQAPRGLEIAYKLHPGEIADWRTAYPWLVASRVRVVEDPGADLYRHLAESRAQVGVYSTALFEGLAFGLETYVADLPGAEMLGSLVEEEPGVCRVSDAEDLAARLREGRTAAPRDVESFFRSDSARRLTDTLEDLLTRPESRQR